MAQFLYTGPPIKFITYKELAQNSSVFSYVGQKAKLTRTFEVDPWSDWPFFVQGMVGYSTLTQKAGKYYIHRVRPDAYPLVKTNGTTWLMAREVTSVEGRTPTGWQADTALGLYATARVNISYESVSYKLLSDDEMLSNQGQQGKNGNPDESFLTRYVTRTLAPTGEYLQLPRGTHQWLSDGAIADQSLGRIINKYDLVYTWHEVPCLPSAVWSALGQINSTVFDGFAVETLYLLAIEVKPYRLVSGDSVYDITYRMRYFEPETGKGHKYFLRYAGSSLFYDKPFHLDQFAVSHFVFESSDFHLLFQEPFDTRWRPDV